MMRGINTTVRRLRRKVFEEVAALGFKADADTLCDDMEAIPYALVNDETEQCLPCKSSCTRAGKTCNGTCAQT